VNVGIEVKKRSFLRYEPLLVTVSLSNLSGRDLLLEDGESQWFSFLVLQGDRDTVLSPRNPDYRLDPLELKIGETVKRTVDLNRLYPVSEYGIHRIRATIYIKGLDKYFTSKTANVDITEGERCGSKLWVSLRRCRMPAACTRSHCFLLRAPAINISTVRITDPSTGNVLCMYKLGHIIDNTQFQAQFDSTNTLHVLQLIGPKTYNLSQVGVNGEMYGQSIYDAPKFKPMLRRDSTGNLDIVGATKRVEAAKGGPTPKLSDRPPGLPGAAKP
jgi:hypothetical protein